MSKVSIIIPVYNSEKYLRICVDQVLNQTFREFEIVLVDDGSTDCSLQVCNELAATDSRIRVIHQENSGVSVARNIGLEQANGEYIAFLDSDDLVSLNYLGYLIQGVEDNNTVLSICGHERIYDYNFSFSDAHESFKPYSAEECANRLLTGHFPVSTWGCLFKRSLIRDIRFPVGIRNNEDKLFLYQYLLKNENGTVAFSNEKLYGYYVREGSATRSSWNGSTDIVTVADQIQEITSDTHPEWNEITQNACLGARLDVMKSIIRAGKTAQGDMAYTKLRREVFSYAWPKTGGHRLKAEYLAVKLGKPVYKALVKTYYMIYTEDKQFKLNEKRTMRT